MRAREARTSSSWPRTSTRSRAISSGSRAAARDGAEDVGILVEHRVVQQQRGRLPGGPHDRRRAFRQALRGGAVGVQQLRAAQPREGDDESRVAQRLGEHGSDPLRRLAIVAQARRELLDHAHGREAAAREAPVDARWTRARTGRKAAVTTTVASAVASGEGSSWTVAKSLVSDTTRRRKAAPSSAVSTP